MRILHCVVPPGKFLLASHNYNLVCIQVTLVTWNKINNGALHISFYLFYFLTRIGHVWLNQMK